MIKQFKIALALFLTLAMLLSFGACKSGQEPAPTTEEAPHVDYVAELRLDMGSTSAKQEVTVKTFIDGDTTHFYFPGNQFDDGVLKARYLAINTPESTGKVEEWGKAAAKFTREKLESATSIIVESDNEKWNADSTGDRYLVWVWYKTADAEEYRNLNLEILQNGLAIASNSANNRYGDTCMAAISQAKTEKLHVYSDDIDPNFHYGAAQEITLKELRCNIADYENVKVAFEGVITVTSDGTAYIEEYDAETGLYFGIGAYYENAVTGPGLGLLKVGNRVRVVATVTQFSGSWQVSGLTYSAMNPDLPDNFKVISTGNTPAYTLITSETYHQKDMKILVGEEMKSFDFVNLSLDTTVTMKDLKVKSIYTTPDGDSAGAMTLTCVGSDGLEIDVRTNVFYNADKTLVTAAQFEGKTIDVKGLIDHFTYDGANDYQIHVFSLGDIVIHP